MGDDEDKDDLEISRLYGNTDDGVQLIKKTLKANEKYYSNFPVGQGKMIKGSKVMGIGNQL